MNIGIVLSNITFHGEMILRFQKYNDSRLHGFSGFSETPEIDEERDRILNIGFSARSPSNNFIVSWKVYVLVMLFTVLFSFLQSYSIPILWVVTLDLDFYLRTPTSVSVDPGSLSKSRLRLTVSEIYLDRWFKCSVNNDWNVWAYCVFDHRIMIFSRIKGFCCFSLNFVVREFMYLLVRPEHYYV